MAGEIKENGFLNFLFFSFLASLITEVIAYHVSGVGMIPSVRTNNNPALKLSNCFTDCASIS
jgi:hypothetical protein